MLQPDSKQLSLAVSKSDIENVKRLMQLGVDLDYPANDENFSYVELSDYESQPWEAPLFLAAWHGHSKVAELLLDAGANPNLATYSPRLSRQDASATFTTAWTPLLAASARGHENLVDHLLKHKADIGWKTRLSNQSAFSLALNSKHWNLAELLLRRGFPFSDLSIDDQLECYGQILDKQNGSLGKRVRELLLNDGVNEETLQKMEFVFSAARSDIASLERGVAKGVPVDTVCPGNMNANALYFAAWNGDVETINWLVKNGANVNYEASGGTVLMRAAIHGHLEAVKALVTAGADPSKRLDGLSALDLVDTREFPSVAEYLRPLTKPKKQRKNRK